MYYISKTKYIKSTLCLTLRVMIVKIQIIRRIETGPGHPMVDPIAHIRLAQPAVHVVIRTEFLQVGVQDLFHNGLGQTTHCNRK